MSDAKWYFNTKTGQVEGEEGARAADRLGPYSSREEAERALQIAAERTKNWDNDPEWNDKNDSGWNDSSDDTTS